MRGLYAWFIHCETGCTCCRNENHYRGPYPSEKAAEIRKEFLCKNPVLASRYAPKGRYTISEAKDAEYLEDGRRLIVEDRVFWGFIWVNSDGSVSESNDDYIGAGSFEPG